MRGEVKDAKCPETGFFLQAKISRGENFTGASAAAFEQHQHNVSMAFHSGFIYNDVFWLLYSSSDDRAEDGLSFLRQRINTISCLGRDGGLSGDR